MTKQNIFFIVLFLFFYGIIWSQDFSTGYAGFDGTVEFNRKDQFVEIKNNIDPSLSRIGHYFYSLEGKIPFLKINEDKILTLHSKTFIFLFASDDQGLGFGLSTSARLVESMQIGKYSASSYLTENTREYLPKYLGYTKPFAPWVEGTEGYGQGEKIQISWSQSFDKTIGIIFSNGFVSYSRPDLYMKNSRVKQIRIESTDGSFSFEKELEDTPNPQNIIFPSPSESIEITILDVYPGDLWEDTCINFIWGIGEFLRPMVDN